MYIIKKEKSYVLSGKSSEDAYCRVLPPVIVVDGVEKRGEMTASDEKTQTGRIDGLLIRDEIEVCGDGIFKAVRSIKNENHSSVRFKSIFEAETIFKPDHFVFPGFNYDITHCDGGVEMGEILCGNTGKAETAASNTPTGMERDEQPWVFAYDREGIPSATISEDKGHHAALLKGQELAQAQKDPENWKLTVFSKSFEIGWAGQGAMLARLFALNGYEKGYEMDVKAAEECLDGFASVQQENGRLFPLYGQYKNTPEDRRRLPDACNIGWAMCELMRSYRMFREHGKMKQNYYDFSVRIADFAVKSFQEDYGFAKTWRIDGTPVSTAGSIGGFMIMGLCEVHRETKEERYLDTIRKAMDFYYKRDLDNFICTAGAIDCACIDKETAYPFLEAALYLYELTGEEIWLERAQKAAYYFFSWMMFCDCIYDSNSDFVKFGYHTTGGTLISAEHSALDPWGALLVDAMFRLWHITGNDNFKIWARMTWWNALLCIAIEDTPEIHGNKRPVGSQNEGFFHCRWTKYRPTCEERGHFNENLQSWMGAWRMYTLATMKREDLEVLWEESVPGRL